MVWIHWKFPWPNKGEKIDGAASTVTRQGAWVLIGDFAYAGFGFAFWAVAARFFSDDQVGAAAALVSLSFLSASLGMLGLDFGLVRFTAKVRHPRRLIAQVLLVTGSLSGIVGFGLTFFALTLWPAGAGDLFLLAGLSALLTVFHSWLSLTDGAMIAAGHSRLTAYRAVGFGGIKVAAAVVVVSAGVAGLLAAYAVPMLIVLLGTFYFVPRLWPWENADGTPHSVRELAPLSVGNWISGLLYSLPQRIAPTLIFLFIDASAVAFFFIAFQLASVLTFAADAIAKSLIAHGSREDRLDRSLTATMRWLLVLILVPLIAIGLVAAPFAMSVIGGPNYGLHALSLQLFLLAVLPKSLYQIIKAQFNIDRRPLALIVSGGSFGLFTLTFLVIGLLLRIDPDALPVSFVLGGIAGVAVAQYLAGWKGRPRTASPDPR